MDCGLLLNIASISVAVASLKLRRTMQGYKHGEYANKSELLGLLPATHAKFDEKMNIECLHCLAQSK